MIERGLTAARHGKLADDSTRLCVVLPKSTMSDIRTVCSKNSMSVSRVVRKYIGAGIRKDLMK